MSRIEMAAALSRTWTARLHRWRGHSRSAAMVALSAAAVFGAAAGFRVFVAPERPDVAVIAQRVGNQADQVGAFASDFVVTWLTATTLDHNSLQRFINLPDAALTLPATPAAVVTAPQVVSVIHSGTAGDAEVYAATVSVTERPYVSAQSNRAFYRVPVTMWNYQPRALTLPARINGPGPGADFRTAYPQAVASDSPVYRLVRGFLTAYLTSNVGLDRYALVDSGLAAVGGYQSIVVSTLSADRSVPPSPVPAAQVHVLATVSAQTAQFATITLVYPLTVENSSGTWMVAAIDVIPQIGDEPQTDDAHTLTRSTP